MSAALNSSPACGGGRERSEREGEVRATPPNAPLSLALRARQLPRKRGSRP